MDVATQADVIENRGSPEEFDLLEGPGDPQFGPLMGFDLRDVFSFEMDLVLSEGDRGR